MVVLACSACGQGADGLSADAVSSELAHSRGGAAGSAADSCVVGADTAQGPAAHGGGGRAAAAADGGNDLAAAAPRAGRSGAAGADSGNDRGSHKPRRSRGAGGVGGSVSEAPEPDAGAAAPDASTEPAPADEPGDSAPPSTPSQPGTPGAPPSASQQFRPQPGTSWQIQLQGALDTGVDAQVFDLDLFETSESDIAQLHAAGRKVICYFDTAYESYRPDSKQLEAYRGNPISGWPGQYWLDIREPAVLSVMTARIALAQSKGCDAVDADDVDGRSNNPGFPLTASDQRSFVTQLSAAAHARGLAFGLKNALEDLAALSDAADFAVNEECFVYDECDLLTPLVQAGKAVFQIEYASGSLDARAQEVCTRANALGFDTIIKRLDLDGPRVSCR